MYVSESAAGTTGASTTTTGHIEWYFNHTTPATFETTNYGSYVTFYFANNCTGGGGDSRFDITIECIDCIECEEEFNMSTTTRTIECGTTYCFYDDGGPTGNYNNNNNTQTLTLNSEGVITIQFIQFATYNNSDRLTVRNGNGTSHTLINGAYGSTLPATVTTTGHTMTIQWQTNAYSNSAGWMAVITASGCPPPCPTPTDVTVSSITDNSAQVSWTGSAEANSYDLRYKFVKFGYDFESAEAWAVDNFAPCTTYDGDGGYTYSINGSTFTNQSYTGSFIAFQNGINENVTAHGGNAFGACFDATTPPNNDFFILPEINIDNGDRLTFWARSYNDNYGLEQFKVGVYASNGTFSSYLAGSATTSVSAPVAWTEFSYDLSAYAGQTIRLAINCVSDDVFAFFIDDISVSSDWINVNNVTSPYTLTGLYSESTYEVQVQSDCGGGSESGWSPSETFTTLPCPEPTNVEVTDVTNNTATVSWIGSADSYNIRWFEFVEHTNVTLTADDVWGDGSGYQMLLDANANTYGTTIPTTGGLTTTGDASAATYAEFEYKIPTNADGALTTVNIVLSNSITIQVPAGTYDWCITNPTPGDRMWIASVNGSIGGRADDFVFEAGFNYEFVVSLEGGNDRTDLTITPIGTVHTANGVTDNPYTITGLTAGATYIVQVQSNCGGSQSNWTDPEIFTTCNLNATIEISN